MLTTFMPRTTFKNQTIVDITKSVKISDLVVNDVVSLQDFTVPDGDRPETVAHDYYDDSSLAWLVLLPNNIVDPYYEWPMSFRDFSAWMKKKYGSLETAKSTILFYEHKTKNITISKDTFDHNSTLTYVSGGDYSAVYAYDYYEKVNENRRHINLISKDYLQLIFRELTKLLPS